jgi:single-stranded-DNA-specific exonuclease
MSRNIVRRKVANNHKFSDSIHPVLRRIYSSRNVSEESDLDYALKYMLPYSDLKGIDVAVELLANSIEKEKNILIVADFDVDGATGCAVAMRGLKSMGTKNLTYLVPSRFDYGYGLSFALVEYILKSPPDLIITVDNGISSIDGVKLARENGIDVLVTDHHLPGRALPEASAIVNPNIDGDTFPSKSLAGVGVMFYLLAALRAYFRDSGWFTHQCIDEPVLADLLDLVALGTVADVVPLDRNNRILVEQGLKRIRSGRCNPGILALLNVAKRSHQKTVASDLGFALGPRLNAAGRLEDMTIGIECLISDDSVHVDELARKLDDLNQERRQIQHEMQVIADEEMLKFETMENLPSALCLYDERWHQGIVGILASRIKDRFHRPVIVFARESDDNLKGSGRSIAGVHMRDILESTSSKNPGLVKKFGGHAMAAGLSLSESDLQEFTKEFQQSVERHLTPELLTNNILSDGELQKNEIDMRLANAITQAGPWGQGFPEPLFDGVFELHDRRILADQHLKLSVSLKGDPKCFDAIAFYTLDESWPEKVEHVQMAYRLNINEFRGATTLQFIIEEISPVS